jgi:hypothetical protein
MKKEQIQAIAEKYRKLACKIEPDDEEKAYEYERFADFIEDNIDIYDDDDYESEADLLTDYNESEAEVDAQWDNIFPEGDEDDSITDFLTQD